MCFVSAEQQGNALLANRPGIHVSRLSVGASLLTNHCSVTRGPDWHTWREAMPAALFKVYGVLYRAPGA